MTEVQANGEDSKDISASVDAEMNKEIVEDDKLEDKDEAMEKEQMGDELVIKEEDEDEVNDVTTNEDLHSKQHACTSNVNKKSSKEIHLKEVTDNIVDDTKDGDAELHEDYPEYNEDDNEEEDKPIDSDHDSVELYTEVPGPDKSVDPDVEANEKIERNEQSSGVPDDEKHNHVISKGNDYVKCEKGAENYCSSVHGSIHGRSSVVDVENSEVAVDEDKKEVKVLVGHVEKNKDVQMAMKSTEQMPAFMFDDASEGGESGTEEEQSAFMKELENLFREKNLEFKAPKFYGEPVNLLKLWRAVIKLGGYDKVTACKLWRQVGESFNPPKTCTTVSWTFRIFYEKALLEYERHKITGGELDIAPAVVEPVSMESPAINSQPSGSGRARRDAAARAMQGWHSQRLLGNGEVSDPIIKEKGSIALKSREKHLKNIVGQKRKKPLAEAAVKASRSKLIKGASDTAVIDVGPAADWVKINVRTTKDCYEVYALVPGLLREELYSSIAQQARPILKVRVQSDPAGRLVISGEPEHPDNPWGVTPFKKNCRYFPPRFEDVFLLKLDLRPPGSLKLYVVVKVVTLPSRIDPHQTSAVVTLHGQLFVRVPFEQSD